MKLTIVSGGQTGADRGAMDAAIHLGLDYGGWAPAGFRAEDGRIPEIYASKMREAKETGEPGRNLALRTRLNVQDSDATLLVTFAERLTGGTKLTANVAKQQRKNCQCLVLPARGKTRIPDGVKDALLEWIRKHRIEVLNVAGPRESKEPGIQAATRDALVWIFEDEVAEELREGARVMVAIGAAVDSDAPLEYHRAKMEAQNEALRREAWAANAPVRAAARELFGVPSPDAAFVAELESAPRPLTLATLERLWDMFYELPGNGAGGSLHVVLDDGNWERSCVEFCRDYARRAGDVPGERFANLLLELSDEQLREYLCPGYCGRCGADYGEAHVRTETVQQTFPPGPCPDCGSWPQGDQTP